MVGVGNVVYTLFNWNNKSIHVGVATNERCLPADGYGLKDMCNIDYYLTQN